MLRGRFRSARTVFCARPRRSWIQADLLLSRKPLIEFVSNYSTNVVFWGTLSSFVFHDCKAKLLGRPLFLLLKTNILRNRQFSCEPVQGAHFFPNDNTTPRKGNRRQWSRPNEAVNEDSTFSFRILTTSIIFFGASGDGKWKKIVKPRNDDNITFVSAIQSWQTRRLLWYRKNKTPAGKPSKIWQQKRRGYEWISNMTIHFEMWFVWLPHWWSNILWTLIGQNGDRQSTRVWQWRAGSGFGNSVFLGRLYFLYCSPHNEPVLRHIFLSYEHMAMTTKPRREGKLDVYLDGWWASICLVHKCIYASAGSLSLWLRVRPICNTTYHLGMPEYLFRQVKKIFENDEKNAQTAASSNKDEYTTRSTMNPF